MKNFDALATALMFALKEEADSLGIERINSVMILKGLLEVEDSPLYEAIFIEQIDCHEFPDFLEQCYDNFFERKPINYHRIAESIKRGIKPATILKKEGKVVYPHIKFKYSDKEYVIYFDLDAREIIKNLDENAGDTAGILDITKALVKAMPKRMLNILKAFNVNTTNLKEYFDDEEEKEKGKEKQAENDFSIPKELKSFVRDLTEEFKGKTCDISGREKECELLWQTLLKQTKRNAVLIGEPGVGKTSVVNKIVFDILEGNCPEEFKNARVLVLDVNASVADTMYRGQSEKRYADLAEFLEKTENIILFIDEIHLIRGAGACRDGEADLSNAIKPILAGSIVRVVGATTRDEYEKYFSQDGAIKRRFRPIEVKEPKSSEVYAILEKSIETLSKYHGVRISKEMVDFIILNSACFNYETKNPDRTKDLIDLSMVVAKNNGKKEVDKECVLANFRYNIEQFTQMPFSTKKTTAFHEAGHCIVQMCSPHLKNHNVIAVSVMPTDSYLGVTVTEENEDFIPEATMEFHIDHIAMLLAGRVAESFYTSKLSSGAWSDLENATKEAQALVSKYGMSSFGRNRVVFPDVNSQKVMNKVNREIDKIIAKAMKRAKKILLDNYNLLHAIVEELVINGIVSETVLKNLREQYK